MISPTSSKLNQDVNSALFDPIAHTPYTEEFDKVIGVTPTQKRRI